MIKSNNSKGKHHKTPKSIKNYSKISNKKIKHFNKDKWKYKKKKLINFKQISKPNKIKSGNSKNNFKKHSKDLMILEIKKWHHKKYSTFNKKLNNINQDCSIKHSNSVHQAMIMKLPKFLKDKSFMSLKNKIKDWESLLTKWNHQNQQMTEILNQVKLERK